MNSIAGFFYHRVINSPDKWHPLLSVYYLTYACRMRCTHCSDGAGVPYHALSEKILAADEVGCLLAIIRRNCDFIVLTGGEPLEHPKFAEVMTQVSRLKFRGVVLTTNGLGIEQHLEVVANTVDWLVFSLQTLDSTRGDAGYGSRNDVHSQIVQNIERAARVAKRRYEIVISSVVTPNNIPDLYDVYHYAQARNFRLAACPQLVGVKAHKALQENPAYKIFFDYLIAEKKRGGRIQGTVDYLEYMRDLRKFRCQPFTMLTVSPSGNVFYPCLELGQEAGNLLEQPNLHELRRLGQKKFGLQPDCDTRCHSACVLGFSRLLANPASLLSEAQSWIRSQFKNGHANGSDASFGNNPTN